MTYLRISHVAILSLTALSLLVYLSYFTVDQPPPIKLHRIYKPIETNIIINTTKNEQINETITMETSTKPTSKPRPTAKPGVIMTYDQYVAGHIKPHTELCPDLGKDLKVAIFVTSAPGHALARAAVRLTWGHYALRTDIAFAFMLGSTDDTKINDALDLEDALYGDLIRGNFMDSYSNLTLKTISMLEWIENYCSKAPRILKTDDDMFINMPRLLDFISSRSKDTRKIYGRVVKKSPIKRLEKSKYYVPIKQYPGKIFPDFTTGPAYLMTNDIVSPLFEICLDEPYVRLEDVYFTGVLASKLNITRVHVPEFFNRRISAHPCTVQKAVSIHMVRYHEQFDLWKKLLDGRSKCGVSIKVV